MSYDVSKMEISMMVEWQLILLSFINNFQTNKARNVIKASGARIGASWAQIEVSGTRIGGFRPKIGGSGAKYGGSGAKIGGSVTKTVATEFRIGGFGPMSGHLGPKLVVLVSRLEALGQ